jgi:hypothetical protein
MIYFTILLIDAIIICSGVTIGAIIYSHYSQVLDKKMMKEGVERDKERLRAKKIMKKQIVQSTQ